ncbi:MAG: galactitol-1-phosphate 5-dehydrogenase [Burkholderiales bacterium]|jgi:alcohol dehydrogenase|nr:galactitol-1-phosphate 5-dehydrogenase [Burkholderiales bacterium]
MKALVYTKPLEVQLLEQPDPLLQEGEVVLQIEAVGICGSDMHAYHGHDPRRKPGLVLGHEFCGKIVQSAAPGFAIGQRVTGNPLITCGICDYCVQGRDNLCSNRTMVGMTRPGAFAQLMSIPAASLIEIPQDMPARNAALTEPAATALHAINMSMRAMARPLPENRTLIIGGGAIGMLSALLLKAYGSRHTVLAEVNPLRRASAQTHAQVSTYDPREEQPQENGFDYVIDAVGSKVTREAALKAVKPGGVIMHIGLQDWASEIDMRKLTLAEITLMGTYTYTTADLRATVAMLNDGVFGDLSWVSSMPLAQGARAFADLDSGALASSKVVLLP